jgi:hypothetical protein
MGVLQAQEIEPDVSVLGRPRPEVDPLNIRVGSLIIAPRIDFRGTYSDNIFATESDKESDFITTIAPSVSVSTDWTRHGLSFSAQAADIRYADNESEDRTSYGAELEGVLDVTDESRLFGGIAYEQRFEERGAPEEQDTAEPTDITALALAVGGIRQFSRFAVRVNGAVDSIDYGNARAADGSFINNDERDYTSYGVGTRVGYRVLPGVQPFLEVGYNVRRHDDAPSRDSDGYRARAGTTLDFTGVTPGSPGNFTGEVFLGFFKQRYDDPELRDPSGLDLGAAVLWNVTGLTSIRLLAERSVAESRQEDVSSYIQTTYGASVEHELLRNLLLEGVVAFTTNEFQGEGDQDQNDLSVGLQGLYLVNRNLTLGLAYQYRQSAAEQENEDFAANAITAFLRLQF